MNKFNFQVKMSKAKVTIRPHMVKNPLLGPISRHRTLNDNSLNWFGCVVGGSAILAKTRSNGQRSS